MEIIPALFLIGRILYGGFFLKSGIGHILKLGGMSQYALGKGVPYPKLAVLGSGLLIIFGGSGVILGAYVAWSLLAIILFLILVTFKMHTFWKEMASGPWPYAIN